MGADESADADGIFEKTLSECPKSVLKGNSAVVFKSNSFKVHSHNYGF